MSNFIYIFEFNTFYKKNKMKKFVLLALAFIITHGVYAQKVGIRGGANLSTMTSSVGDSDDFKTSLVGFNAGLIYELKVIPMVFVQAELIYSQKGVYYEFLNGDYKNQTINYIEIPISAKLKLGPTPLYIIAGPYFGYGLNGNTKTKIGSDETTLDIDWEKEFKRTDFGVNAGFGARFGLAPIAVFIEGRYGIGLSDINNTNGSLETINNRALQFSAGLLFEF